MPTCRQFFLYCLPPLLTAGALAWVLFGVEPGSKAIGEAVPGRDGRVEGAGDNAEQVRIGEIAETLLAPDNRPPAQVTQEWPWFRGPTLDLVAPASYRVPIPGVVFAGGESPGPGMAIPRWEVETGEGYAAAAVAHGNVYLLDYDERRRADMLRCFDAASGSELWRRGYRVDVRRNHGLSRTIPAVWEDVVITLGPRGQVMACDAHDGSFLWGLDLAREFGTEIPMWNAGQCPVIDNGTLLLAPAGPEVLMLGMDPRTGEVLWQTPNPGGWRMSHSSISVMELGGERVAVYAALGGIAGVALEGARTGEILFANSEWINSVVVPSPLQLPGNRIFLTAGYGAGGAIFQVVPADDGGEWQVGIEDKWHPPQGLSSEQQTPVLAGEYIFGVLPKSAGRFREQLACYHVSDLRKPLWTSGPGARFGLGPFLVADGKILLVDDEANLTVAEATPDAYRPLLTLNVVAGGHDAWGPLALADGLLFVKESHKLVCLDLAQIQPSGHLEAAR